MFLRIRTYLLLLLVALATEAAAHLQVRDTSINVNFYGVEAGLPNPEVTAMFRDSFGLMWIGTDGGGVSCFDASVFFNYYPNHSIRDSLADGYITAIAEDKDHNIWLATHAGVSCLNRSSMRFQNYPISYATRDGNTYKGVLSIYFDREDQCWLASMRGLGKFNSKTGEVEWYDFPFLLNQQNLYLNNKILEDKESNIWVLVSGVLLCWDRELEQYKRLETSQYETGHTKLEVITGFAFDSKFRLCVATLNAIYVYRDAINLPFVYHIPYQNIDNKYALIDGFWLGDADELWCIIDNKIYFINRETGEWLCIDKIYSRTEQLGYVPNASCNFEGKNVYFLPVDGGFATWSHKPLFFSQDMLQPNNRSSLYNKKILGIYTQDDNDVWVGTANGTILRLDYTTDSVADYTPKDLPLFKGRSCVTSFYRFFTGELIGGTNRGLIYFNQARNCWTTDVSSTWLQKLFTTLGERTVNKIGKFDRTRYLFATNEGLTLYNKHTEKASEVQTLHGKDVRDFALEEEKNILCIANRRVYRVNVASPRVSPVIFCDTLSGVLALPPSAICIAEDGKNRRNWIGTDDGLFILPYYTDTCVQVVSHNYFRSNPINSLVCDSQGNVWIATERGIVEYDPTTRTLFFFGKSDGLFHTAFNRNASYISPLGKIYFGGQNGLTRFHARPRNEYEEYPILLTKLELVGHDLPNAEIATLVGHELVVPRGYHSLTFYLSHLNYGSNQQPRYQVMIEDLYERWSDVLSGNLVNINNLPPGSFTFRFRTSRNGVTWTEGTPYHLVIEGNSSLESFFRSYLPLFTLLLLIIAIVFGRRHFLDRHGKFNEQIRATMSLEALNQDLQRQSQILRTELRNARHTQDVILPTIETLQQRCPDSFILFKPLREVSGDIFWYSEHANYLYLGVIDCTGHGTSAAIMSLLTYVFLHSIIVEQHTTGAAKILGLLSNSLYERNARIKDVEAMSEGADVSICVIDTKRKMIDFAGAFQRIIHRHDGQTDVYIGDATFVDSEQNQSYNSRLIHYNPSDFLYLFSDGYSDQLGGEYAKKMRFARFQGHIEAASQHSISQQKEFLLEELAKWQGANAQYDDITILGFQCTFRDFV